MRLSRASLILLAFLALSACASPPEPQGRRIETDEDLLAALAEAGVEVVETAMLAARPPLMGGRVVFLRDERVEIYEAESQEAQRDAVRDLLRNAPVDAAPAVWGRGRVVVIYDGLDGPTIAVLSGLMGDVVSLPEDVVVEPYPPAVAAAIGWVSEAYGSDPGSIVVLGYEQAEWPDACLGLAAPDEMCAGVITPGWEVVLQIGEEVVTVRTDDLGGVVRAEP